MIEIGTTITLNDTEQRLCKFVAKQRNANARKKGVKNSKIGKQSDEETDLEGFGAELAFCRLANVYPDLLIEAKSSQRGEDKGGDSTLRNGWTVDVKATTYTTGRLIAVPWKKSGVVDLFALMTGEFPTYRFRGFMEESELLRQERIGNLGHGPGFIAEQYELKNFNIQTDREPHPQEFIKPPTNQGTLFEG